MNKLKKIISEKGKTKITILIPKTNIETIFTLKNKTKNYYYLCTKRSL